MLSVGLIRSRCLLGEGDGKCTCQKNVLVEGHVNRRRGQADLSGEGGDWGTHYE